MGRLFTELKCGCLVSCDGGGGLIGDCDSEDCQVKNYLKEHKSCPRCGECLKCFYHNKCLEVLQEIYDYCKSDMYMMDSKNFIKNLKKIEKDIKLIKKEGNINE